jgi:putative transposase
LEWFRNRIEARIVIEDWRRHYNEVRPHSSLGYLTPLQMAQSMKTCLSTHAISQMAVV